MFANMYRAYETLSEPIKKMLAGMTAMHDGEHVYRGRYGVNDEGKVFPKAEQPIVRTHPVTGRQALYVNRGFTTRIVRPKAQRERRNTGDAVPAHRDAGAVLPLQVAGELHRLLGQPLRPASRAVGLLSQQALWPPRDNLRRQAVLPRLSGRHLRVRTDRAAWQLRRPP